MPVKLLTSGGGGVNLVPSSSIASDQTIYLPTSGTSGGTVLCTDSSGNLGLGTSSPSAKLDIQTNVNGQSWASYRNLNAGGTSGYFLGNDQFSDVGALGVQGSSSGAFGGGNSVFVGTWRAYPLAFITNNAERMRLDSSGNLLVGTTSNANTSRVYIRYDTVSTQPILNSATTTSASTSWSHFIGQSGNGSSITTNNILIYGNGNIVNANNSYGSISDIKLKENIVDATPKLNKLCQVRVVNYNLIGDYEKHNQLGVIAQELEEVFPNMVDETPDYEEVTTTDEDGNEKTERVATGTTTKSVKYSVFVPMLIKAIQEQQAIIESQAQTIESLTQRIEALEYTKQGE